MTTPSPDEGYQQGALPEGDQDVLDYEALGKAGIDSEAASRDEHREAIHEALEHFLQLTLLDPSHAQRVNQGNNGIIIKLEVDPAVLSEIEEGTSLSEMLGTENHIVAKILKVYSNGVNGRKEFDTQEKAFTLVKEAMQNERSARASDTPEVGGESRSYYAAVPRPISYHDLLCDPDLSQRLQTLGARAQGHAEVVLMDYVEGADVATILYSELLKKHPKAQHLQHEHVDTWNIDDLTNEIARLFYYSHNEVKQDADTLAAVQLLYKRNADILTTELARIGVTVDPHIIKQIENTIRLFNDGGVFMRDAHPRNFHITGDIQKGGNATVLDYGDASLRGRPIEAADYESTDGTTRYESLENIVHLLKEINRKGEAFNKKMEHSLHTALDRRFREIELAPARFAKGLDKAFGFTQPKNGTHMPSVEKKITEEIVRLQRSGTFDARALRTFSYITEGGQAKKITRSRADTRRNKLLDDNALLTGVLGKLYEAYTHDGLSEEQLKAALAAIESDSFFSGVIHDETDLRYWREVNFTEDLFQRMKESKAIDSPTKSIGGGGESR